MLSKASSSLVRLSDTDIPVSLRFGDLCGDNPSKEEMLSKRLLCQANTFKATETKTCANSVNGKGVRNDLGSCSIKVYTKN